MLNLQVGPDPRRPGQEHVPLFSITLCLAWPRLNILGQMCDCLLTIAFSS